MISPSMVVLLLSLADAQPEPTTTTSACTAARFSFEDCLVLTLGLGVFGDFFPTSSVKAPGTTRGQRSLMGGARFWIGTRWPNHLALRGVFEIGYATVGPFPDRGSDGLVEGGGLELSLDYFRLVKPFVRFMYNAIVLRIASIRSAKGDGILQNNAWFAVAGVQLSIVELNLSLGRDLAGGLAPGIGFSVNWMY